MIWLASFPRSGNTFVRNILLDVYGIESSTYHQEDHPLDENYHEYTFVKTHLLPDQLPHGSDIPAVYLVRDGRDALISLAHHRSDIIVPGSDLMSNLKEAILAAEGSYFGGWSANVEAWLKRADIVIRFEDLVQDPIGQIERIRAVYPDLPQPDTTKLPTFESQKFGAPRYGSGGKIAPDDQKKALEITGNWFRKGKTNGWKDEFTADLHRLFWSYHRITMERLGYTYTGEQGFPNTEIDYEVLQKTGRPSGEIKTKKRVLIEANKLLMHRNDGIKRYVSELLKALYPISTNSSSEWQIDLFLDGKVRPLSECGDALFDSSQNENRPQEKRSAVRTIIHYGKELSRKILPESIYERAAILVKKAIMKLRLKRGKHAINRISKLIVDQDTPSYDIIHVPLLQHYEPFVNLDGPFVVTLHDLTHRQFPLFHTQRNIDLAEKGLQFFIEKNAHVITISESTRAAMDETEGLNSSLAITIPEAADPTKFKPLFNSHYARLVRRFYKIPEDIPFILTVSTLEPRKNLLNTIKAFEAMIAENPELNALLEPVLLGGKQKNCKRYVTVTGFYLLDLLMKTIYRYCTTMP
jgi:glycosyltransferase involved in cell wall biosynthesis